MTTLPSDRPLIGPAIHPDNTRHLATIAAGAGISLVGNVTAMALSLAFQWLMARLLGPSGIGTVALATSIITLGMLVSLLGYPQALSRFLAPYSEQQDHGAITAAIVGGLALVALVSLLVAALFLSLAEPLAQAVFHEPGLVPVLLIMSTGLPLAAITRFLVSAAGGLMHVEHQVGIEQMLVPALKIALFLAFVSTVGRNVRSPALATTAATAIGAAVAIVTVGRLHPFQRPQFARLRHVTTTMLAFSWPLMLGAIVNLASQETETLLLGALVPTRQVGIYYTSLRVTFVLGMPLLAFTPIFAPIMATLFEDQSLVQLGRLFRTVSRWGFTLFLPAFVVVFSFGEDLLHLFGPEFVAGTPVVRILALSQLVNVAAGSVGWLLVMAGHPRLNLLNATISLVLNIAFVLWLAPAYGIVGAAIAGALALLIANLLRLAQAYLLLHIHPFHRSYLKPIAAGLVSMVAAAGTAFIFSAWPPPARLGVGAAAVAIVYGAVLRLAGLQHDDRLVVALLSRRIPFLSLIWTVGGWTCPS